MNCIKYIVSREMADNYKSLQFITLLIISTILFLIGSIVNTNNYNKRNNAYIKQVDISRGKPSTISTEIYKEPSYLAFIADGGENVLPMGYSIGPMGKIKPIIIGKGNYLLRYKPNIDWTLIIKIVYSLYAILLGYNSIVGEKHNGTMRIVLSNSVSRYDFLISKYLSVLITLLIPMMIGICSSLMISMIFLPKIITLQNLVQIVVFMFISIAYISLFTLMSLIISSSAKSQSICLFIMVIIWIVIVVVIPNISNVMTLNQENGGSEYQLSKKMGPIFQQKLIDQVQKVIDEYGKGEIEDEKELYKHIDNVYMDAQKEINSVVYTYEMSMKARKKKANEISKISPASLFQYSAESIALTGEERNSIFYKRAIEYSKIYDRYILNKIGKIVPNSGISIGFRAKSKKGKYLDIEPLMPEEYAGNKSDFPWYSDTLPSNKESLRHIANNMVLIIIWNIILVMMAFMAINKADIR